MKVTFFSAKSYDRLFFDRYNKKHDLIYTEIPLDNQSAELAKGSEGICVFVNDKLDEGVVEKLAKLGVKIIVLRCAGFNNVDLNAAGRHNIIVARVPAYSPHAVAEHAAALILCLNRKIHKAYNRIREGNFSLDRLTGFDLFGKTVGVIGTGKIGQAFCEIMLGFGCKLLAFDLIANKEMEKRGVVYLPFTDVLERSDIISLHCPLNELSRHLLNETTFKCIKKGAMLINTSRGALIDSKAAIAALKSGQLGYLGIDVYEQEGTLFFNDLSGEVIQDDLIMRLISFPNVLVTSHQGFLTEEALSQIAMVTLQNLDDFENGTSLHNRV